MYKTILIKDGEIYNIYNGIRRTRDVYIENGIIKDIDISLNIKADIVLNAKKKFLFLD